MIRPTECTGAPALSGASAMQHIQPLSEVQHTYAEQGLMINASPSQSTDEPKGARHVAIYLFTPSALGMWVRGALQGQIHYNCARAG